MNFFVDLVQYALCGGATGLLLFVVLRRFTLLAVGSPLVTLAALPFLSPLLAPVIMVVMVSFFFAGHFIGSVTARITALLFGFPYATRFGLATGFATAFPGFVLVLMDVTSDFAKKEAEGKTYDKDELETVERKFTFGPVVQVGWSVIASILWGFGISVLLSLARFISSGLASIF